MVLPLVLNHSVSWDRMCAYLEVDTDNRTGIQLDSRECSFGKFVVTPTFLADLGRCGVQSNLKIGQSIELPQVCFGFERLRYEKVLLLGKIYLTITGDDKFLQLLFGTNIPGSVFFEVSITNLKGNGTDCLFGNYLTTSFQPRNVGKKTDAKCLEMIWSCGEDIISEMQLAWESEASDWTCVMCLGLSFTVPNKPTEALLSSLVDATRKLLTEELLSDATILVQNGSEIKCHRSILAAQSGFFAGMFQTNMSEAQTGTVELSGMSEDSVRALLQFLYTREIISPQENSALCLDLLQAGHKYDIPNLTGKMTDIFQTSSASWYSVDVALQLYLFCRKAEMSDLMEKSMEILKLKFKDLMETCNYEELFVKNKDAAVELVEFFLH